jgi:hypothetical protein
LIRQGCRILRQHALVYLKGIAVIARDESFPGLKQQFFTVWLWRPVQASRGRQSPYQGTGNEK